MNPTRSYSFADKLRLVYAFAPVTSNPAYAAALDATILAVWGATQALRLNFTGFQAYNKARLKIDIGGHATLYAKDAGANVFLVSKALNNYNCVAEMRVEQNEIQYIDYAQMTPGQWLEFVPENPYSGIQFSGADATNIFSVRSESPQMPPDYLSFTEFKLLYTIYPVFTVDLFL